MAQQAATVYKLTTQHATIHNDRWRDVQVSLAQYNLPQASPALDTLDQLETAVIAKQREAAQPKAHTFLIVPAA